MTSVGLTIRGLLHFQYFHTNGSLTRKGRVRIILHQILIVRKRPLRTGLRLFHLCQFKKHLIFVERTRNFENAGERLSGLIPITFYKIGVCHPLLDKTQQ